MFYFDKSRGVYERITGNARDILGDFNLRVDGLPPADKPKIPLYPPIIPPPVGEVTDEEEKEWRRKLQAAEASAEKGLDDD